MDERRKLTEEEKASKPLTEDPVKIDLGEWKEYYDIFILLRDRLGLPSFCGKNWYAIWDLVRYMGREPLNIEFYGAAEARKIFPGEIETLFEVFDEIHAEEPNIAYVVID